MPTGSWLHRRPAGAKLLGLALVAVAVGAVRLLPAPAAAAGEVALAALAWGLCRSAGLGRAYPWQQLRRLWVVLVALAVVQVWLAGPLRAVAVLAGLLACLWTAAAVTGSTPVPALLDALVRLLRPLRRVGVDPDHVALALALAVSSVPVMAGLLAQSREAALARGLERDPRALLAPVAVRAVAHAHDVGEALAARGLVD